jgi:hypothetical protein
MPESRNSTNHKTEFNWGLQPDAENMLQNEINKFLESNAYAASLSNAMIEVTTFLRLGGSYCTT